MYVNILIYGSGGHDLKHMIKNIQIYGCFEMVLSPAKTNTL